MEESLMYGEKDNVQAKQVESKRDLKKHGSYIMSDNIDKLTETPNILSQDDEQDHIERMKIQFEIYLKEMHDPVKNNIELKNLYNKFSLFKEEFNK